jgi:hypothetical protein
MRLGLQRRPMTTIPATQLAARAASATFSLPRLLNVYSMKSSSR